MQQIFLMDGVEFGNVMIDMETWGTDPGSAIRSIGAVEFNPHLDKMGETFYANITDQSCLDAGLVKSQSTVAWWAKQSRAAQEALLVNQRPLREVLEEFSTWYRRVRGVFPWSQGANFDQPLIEAAYRAVKLRAPYKYSDSRDTRTAYDMGQLHYSEMPTRVGTHHNALDDAIHQARCVRAAYARVRIVEGK